MLLLLLLLLPTPICAERKLFRSELTFDIAPTCAKPGTNIHFVKTVQCPCFIAFGLSSTTESSTRVDFLVLSHDNFRTWQNEKFVPEPEILSEYSFLSRSAVSISLLDKQYSYETSNLELPRNDSFTFVIRTHSEKEDCDMQLLHIFEPQPTPCPTHLPEHALGNGRQNVVAGVPGDNELQNHMVLISSFSGACSGSVIGANYILTAAHCAPHGGKAFIGGRTAKSGREYDIVKFIPHPSYNGSNNGRLEAHDIGIARVSGNLSRHIVKYSKVMAPSGDFVRAAGYGQIAEGWVTGDERQLRTVDMAVMRFGDCVKRFVEFGARGFARALEQGSHVCVGGECGDTCYGDSGGPIVVNDDGAGYVQVGIVSGGIGCARPRLPGIYTKLGEYGDWVEEVTGVRGVVLEFGNVGVEEELVAVGDDGARLKIVGLGVLASSVGLGVLLLVGMLVWTQIRRNRNGDTEEIMANEDRERVMSFSKIDLC